MTIKSLHDFTPGTRVVVQHSGHLSGKTGVVVEMAEKLLNGHAAAAQLDSEAWAGWPLCFYSHELAVEK